MDIGYVILLLLVLVYACTAAFLYLRARNAPSGPNEPQDGPPQEADVNGGPPPGNGGRHERPAEDPSC